MASRSGSLEAELGQRFSGEGLWGSALQENGSDRIGQGKQFSTEVVSGGDLLHLQHALVSPVGGGGGGVGVGGRCVGALGCTAFAFLSVSYWLKAVGKWWLGIITSQEHGATERQVNTEKSRLRCFAFLGKRASKTTHSGHLQNSHCRWYLFVITAFFTVIPR